MLISLAVVPVSDTVWISNVTDEDVLAFGRPQTTGFGSHLIRLRKAELTAAGLLTFERSDALLIRRGRTPEAVLFRELVAGGGRTSAVVSTVVSPDDTVYWVTVGTDRQGNFEIGMRNGVWGVPAEYGDRLRGVEPRDKIIFYGRDVGFALCEVKSQPFRDTTALWPDGEYPYRVRVTPPLLRNEADDFRAVYRYLADRNGQPYASTHAAGRAIGGHGGVFRRLRPGEISGILRGLGWS